MTSRTTSSNPASVANQSSLRERYHTRLFGISTTVPAASCTAVVSSDAPLRGSSPDVSVATRASPFGHIVQKDQRGSSGSAMKCLEDQAKRKPVEIPSLPQSFLTF